MERLDDLVLFKQVVESQGFAAAARGLGMQRSKLSRRIAELEARMGVRLLQRNTRNVSPTPAGERVFEHACALAREAQAAFDVAAELKGEPVGVLRITCPVSFAGAVLMPVFAQFCALHPKVHVAIDASDRKSDLVGENFELAFRVSGAPPEDSSLVARPVGEVAMIVAGHPELLGERRALEPEDLQAFGLLANATHDGIKTLGFVHPDKGTHTLRFTPRMLSSNMSVLHAAVLNGLGLACLPRYLCAPYLATGHLLDAFADGAGWRPEPVRMYALLPASRGMALATRLFLEFSLPRLAQRLGG